MKKKHHEVFTITRARFDEENANANKERMRQNYLKAGIICFILSMMLSMANGQSILVRISVTERYDGLGYVTRFHLNAPVDSSVYFRSASHYIQLKLYGVDFEAEQFRPLESNIYDNYTDITINRID